MEKLENIIKQKESEPAPPATICKRCGGEAKPKFVTILGWRQQEFCDQCLEVIRKEQEAREAEKQKTDKISKLFDGSGIMRGKFSRMAFGTFESKHQGKAFEAAMKYAEAFGSDTKNGLFFFGKAGAGKTHLVVSIARCIIDQKQIAVKFARVIDLLMDIRRTYNADEYFRTENEMELLRACLKSQSCCKIGA